MITLNRHMEYVTAEPFLPFRMKMASGAVYEIKHPETILIGRNAVRVYNQPGWS
jgi:hypothetical protein